MIEMTLENIFDLFKRKDPKKVEDAPKRIKIIEKPRTKSKDFSNIKYFDFFWRFSKSVPQIKDKYPGINGSTQGDKKLTIPATKLKNRRDIVYIPSNLFNWFSESNW